ncbi:MAG: TetR/AcrR family transcriptional regulator, partial [Clostridium beijerinckii]
MNTREKIISESLNLFSRKGFEAISVRDIAKAVGIKASSLYNHFKNKQDIFDTIIQKYSDLVNKFLNSIKIRDNSDENLPNKTNWLSDEYFFKKSSYIFNFYLEDENMIKFRKLLTIEQCNNSKLSDLYNKLFIDDILDYQAEVFSKLISSIVFINKDPYT